MNGADALCDTLLAAGVEAVFVNGALSYEEDAAAPAAYPRNGRFLRRGMD